MSCLFPPSTLLLKDSLFFSFNREGSSLSYKRVRTGPQVSLDCRSEDFPTKSHHFSVITSSFFVFQSSFKGNSRGMAFSILISSFLVFSFPPHSCLPVQGLCTHHMIREQRWVGHDSCTQGAQTLCVCHDENRNYYKT